MARAFRWLGRAGKRAAHRGGVFFGEKRYEEAIGYLYLQDINWHARSTGLGLVVGSTERWSEGIGQEVCRRLLEYAFVELNLRRVAIQVHADQPVLRCYTKVGFRDEGRLREAVVIGGKYGDLLLMSVLEQEWLTSPPAPQNGEG